MFLSVAVRAVDAGDDGGETFRRVASAVRKLADALALDDSCESAAAALRDMNAFVALQESSARCVDYSSADSGDERRAVERLVMVFAGMRPDSLNPDPVDEFDDGLWMETFALLTRKNVEAMPDLLRPAAVSSVNELCDCLYVPLKQWCAFQLLQVFARDAEPLQSGDDIDLSPGTEQALSTWKDGMDQEEANELEEDVFVAATWLPESIMSLLESIAVESPGSDPDSQPNDRLMGDLLAWITTLDALDAAGSVDMRNRSSISSYIRQTNALGRIMEAALQVADLDVLKDESIFSCVELGGREDFAPQRVAALAVFRSVESLPTLVKTWYGDDCPRFLRQRLGTFVENVVAPATLQRELDRIKSATSFGEMSVRGSVVSREVIATYYQDEVRLICLVFCFLAQAR